MTETGDADTAVALANLQRALNDVDTADARLQEARRLHSEAVEAAERALLVVAHAASLCGQVLPRALVRALYWGRPEIRVTAIANALGTADAGGVCRMVGASDGTYQRRCHGCREKFEITLNAPSRSAAAVELKKHNHCPACLPGHLETQRRKAAAHQQFYRDELERLQRLRERVARGDIVLGVQRETHTVEITYLPSGEEIYVDDQGLPIVSHLNVNRDRF